jgi:peptidoglycan/LPS O-acetylase OafA/YrhL
LSTHHRSFPLSEGGRGLTAFAIVALHIFMGTNGFHEGLGYRLMYRLDVCVAMFFALSAFLLYRPMIAHRAGGPRGPSVADFARRRFFRIYPTYWFTLVVLAIYPGLNGVFGDSWWKFFTLASNWSTEYSSAECYGGTDLCGLPQTWTLATELTFYVALPALAAAGAWLFGRGGTRAELAWLGGLGLLSLLSHALAPGLRGNPWYDNTLLAHFDWLAVGMVLAVASVAFEGRRDRLPQPLDWLSRHPGQTYLAALAVYLLMVATLPPVPFRFEGDTSLYVIEHVGHAVLSGLLLVPVVFGNPNQGAVRRLLGHPVLIWFGLISYGIYLWHFSVAYELLFNDPEASFGTVLLLTLAVSVPLAAFSWYVIEKPLMRFKYGSSWRRAAPSLRDEQRL